MHVGSSLVCLESGIDPVLSEHLNFYILRTVSSLRFFRHHMKRWRPLTVAGFDNAQLNHVIELAFRSD